MTHKLTTDQVEWRALFTFYAEVSRTNALDASDIFLAGTKKGFGQTAFFGRSAEGPDRIFGDGKDGNDLSILDPFEFLPRFDSEALPYEGGNGRLSSVRQCGFHTKG